MRVSALQTAVPALDHPKFLRRMLWCSDSRTQTLPKHARVWPFFNLHHPLTPGTPTRGLCAEETRGSFQRKMRAHAALVLAGALLLLLIGNCAAENAAQAADVVVVGAGIAGLAAAQNLTAAGGC